MYASTPILVILRTLIALAIALCWAICSVDTSTALLHAPLSEGAAMCLVPPVELYPEKKTLWKLKKAIYGRRSSPRQERFADTMAKLPFRRLQSDSSVYEHDKRKLVVLA